jgi:hypothetical protein
MAAGTQQVVPVYTLYPMRWCRHVWGNLLCSSSILPTCLLLSQLWLLQLNCQMLGDLEELLLVLSDSLRSVP